MTDFFEYDSDQQDSCWESTYYNCDRCRHRECKHHVSNAVRRFYMESSAESVDKREDGRDDGCDFDVSAICSLPPTANKYKCSKCGKEFIMVYRGSEESFEYCPMCGAKRKVDANVYL